VVPGLAGILLSALFVGGTFVAITMLAMREALAIAGAQAPRLMAALTAAFAAGQVAGPVFVSVLVDAGGSFNAGLSIASAVLAVGACLLFNRRPKT